MFCKITQLTFFYLWNPWQTKMNLKELFAVLFRVEWITGTGIYLWRWKVQTNWVWVFSYNQHHNQNETNHNLLFSNQQTIAHTTHLPPNPADCQRPQTRHFDKPYSYISHGLQIYLCSISLPYKKNLAPLMSYILDMSEALHNLSVPGL